MIDREGGYRSEDLKVEYAIVDKRRVNAKRVEAKTLIGDVQGENVVLVDDICSTGGTLSTASSVCKKGGAKAIRAVVTHGLFVGRAFGKSAIEKMIVTNTIPIPKGFAGRKIRVVSVAPLFAKAIDSIANAKSISTLFQ